MEPSSQINYNWLLNEIKDLNLPQNIGVNYQLGEIDGFKDKIKIAFTIYGYPIIGRVHDSIESMFYI